MKPAHKSDARCLSAEKLTELRKRGVEAVQSGKPAKLVAEDLGVTRQALFNWLALYRAGGWQNLDASKRGGRPRLLTGLELNWLYNVVTLGNPEQLQQFPFALWTSKRLCEALFKKFGIRLSKASMCRLLSQLGLSPQRPLWRAWQQDPAAVEKWLKEEFPAIQRQAKKAKGEIWFGDEAGVRSDFHHGTTWARKGQTPVVKTTGGRFGLNLISAVNRRGAMRFMCVKGRVNAGVVVEFMRRLLSTTQRPVFLILDGHPAHKAKSVRTFAEKNKDRLHVFYLPGYSPDLNPDEWAWRNRKVHGTGRQSIEGPDHLLALVTKTMMSLQRRAPRPPGSGPGAATPARAGTERGPAGRNGVRPARSHQRPRDRRRHQPRPLLNPRSPLPARPPASSPKSRRSGGNENNRYKTSATNKETENGQHHTLPYFH